MKTSTITVLLSALFVGGPVLADDMGGMKMDGHSTTGAESTSQSAKAVGIIKALDPAKGTVTLKHGPIPSIKWPAMTMAFKITPEQAAPLKVGEQVEFEFVTSGMDATITRITAQ
jgi:Cu(I)/Ag(I) efflux system protein CusF